ncbi:MAG: aminoglycoside phosphotransferase family protein, partial [Actinomycetota bacterium]|nr:aminoglycoside phosphotransferase family protein [Actinomycetota bacterium]
SAPPPAPAVILGPENADDAWASDLQLLLGGEAQGPLSALIETASGELLSFRPRQVTHQPATPGGRSSTIVQYAAQVRWAGGQVASETLVMATGGRIPRRAAVVDGDGVRVGIWRWPFDPDLPGLASAVDADTVSALLADLGMGGGTVRLTVRAYRPGRRAVIEASGTRGRVFLKVVRPHRVEALHDQHRLLARHLPVPHSYGYSTDGILVLQALYGGSLRGALTGSAVPLPDAGALQGLLDQLPAELAETQIRGDHLGRAAHYADVVAGCLPDERTRLDELLGHLARVDPGDHPTVAVHGDFYEGQILVNRGRVSGLLDVDTAGAGHRIDEWATVLAHLSVLGMLHPKARRIKRYGAQLLAGAETRYSAGELRPRISAAVLGLATGPFRVLLPRWPEQTRQRIALAEQWLGNVNENSYATVASRSRGDEERLIVLS